MISVTAKLLMSIESSLVNNVMFLIVYSRSPLETKIHNPKEMFSKGVMIVPTCDDSARNKELENVTCIFIYREREKEGEGEREGGREREETQI